MKLATPASASRVSVSPAVRREPRGSEELVEPGDPDAALQPLARVTVRGAVAGEQSFDAVRVDLAGLRFGGGQHVLERLETELWRARERRRRRGEPPGSARGAGAARS